MLSLFPSVSILIHLRVSTKEISSFLVCYQYVQIRFLKLVENVDALISCPFMIQFVLV